MSKGWVWGMQSLRCLLDLQGEKLCGHWMDIKNLEFRAGESSVE